MSNAPELYFRYWTAFSKFPDVEGKILKMGNPRKFFTLSMPLAHGCRLAAVISENAKTIRSELVVEHPDFSKRNFKQLHNQRKQIHYELGFPLHWNFKKENGHNDKVAEIVLPDVDPADEADWPNQFEWHKATLEKMHGVFARRVKALQNS